MKVRWYIANRCCGSEYFVECTGLRAAICLEIDEIDVPRAFRVGATLRTKCVVRLIRGNEVV